MMIKTHYESFNIIDIRKSILESKSSFASKKLVVELHLKFKPNGCYNGEGFSNCLTDSVRGILLKNNTQKSGPLLIVGTSYMCSDRD